MLYVDYGSWIRERFGHRMQKLSVDAGFSCPNRDGRLSYGGCSFCDNTAFTPSYCNRGDSLREQLAKGKRFYSNKYPDMGYLAYFQSYSGTYSSLSNLKRLYEEALSVDGVEGIVIGTRPDCLSEELLDYLATLSRQTYVSVEIGIESANDNTLKRMNRCHNFLCSKNAVEALFERGIITGGHVILGLPGESKDEIIRQAEIISALPLTMLKIHQLQIISGTPLAREYLSGAIKVMTIEEYIPLLADYISHLRKDIVLERFFSSSPLDKVIAPHWGLKPDVLNGMLRKFMEENNLHQGMYS